MKNLEFQCPQAVSAGELVMNPTTGNWGYARQNYNGGDMGTFSTGSGFVMTVNGNAQPGCDLFIRNGIITAAAAMTGQSPCATVLSVIEKTDTQTTVLVALK